VTVIVAAGVPAALSNSAAITQAAQILLFVFISSSVLSLEILK
jgi:hypothetical protein